jgi:hypothetical protein
MWAKQLQVNGIDTPGVQTLPCVKGFHSLVAFVLYMKFSPYEVHTEDSKSAVNEVDVSKMLQEIHEVKRSNTQHLNRFGIVIWTLQHHYSPSLMSSFKPLSFILLFQHPSIQHRQR